MDDLGDVLVVGLDRAELIQGAVQVHRRLASVDAWRTAHGLPEEVFFTVPGRARKPMWLAFDSPVALAYFEQVSADSPVTFTEALPTRGERPTTELMRCWS